MEKVIIGNYAVSYGAQLARVQVIAAYPITPQTQIVEKLAEMCASGELNARFIPVESEHSAMASTIGAAATGARAFTATSSQGLALMHEMIHWAAASRLPIVMANVNRALGPGWSIWADQNDSLSQRDTGWLQFYCESNQEVLDTVLQGYRIAEQVMLPVMINLDGFLLSHTSEPVDIPDQALVDRYLPLARRDLILDPDDPHSFGGLVNPEHYMEMRHKMHQAQLQGKEAAREADAQFKAIFGRSYGLVEGYRLEGAELALVVSGTIASTSRVAVDRLREQGEKVGLLKIRMFRPFPGEEVGELLGGFKKVAVIDRNISFGHGGIFCQELKSALYNLPKRPQVYGYIAGLGGRDVTPQTILDIAELTACRNVPPAEADWIWVKV
ncbi:MAG: pyruvate ferredoxin oxidoreductase [Chloroflexi bacterium]|nr:pyruvate ferredoxin oxidoreductase [Chloroflexota bacterium]